MAKAKSCWEMQVGRRLPPRPGPKDEVLSLFVEDTGRVRGIKTPSDERLMPAFRNFVKDGTIRKQLSLSPTPGIKPDDVWYLFDEKAARRALAAKLRVMDITDRRRAWTQDLMSGAGV